MSWHSRDLSSEGGKPNQIFIFSYQYFLNQCSGNRIASSLRDQRIENGKDGNVSSLRGPEIASSEGNGNVSDLKSEAGVRDRATGGMLTSDGLV